MQSPAWPVRSRSGTQSDSSDHRCPGRIAMAQMDWIASFTWNVPALGKKQMEYSLILSHFQPCDSWKHEVGPIVGLVVYCRCCR